MTVDIVISVSLTIFLFCTPFPPRSCCSLLSLFVPLSTIDTSTIHEAYLWREFYLAVSRSKSTPIQICIVMPAPTLAIAKPTSTTKASQNNNSTLDDNHNLLSIFAFFRQYKRLSSEIILEFGCFNFVQKFSL